MRKGWATGHSALHGFVVVSHVSKIARRGAPGYPAFRLTGRNDPPIWPRCYTRLGLVSMADVFCAFGTGSWLAPTSRKSRDVGHPAWGSLGFVDREGLEGRGGRRLGSLVIRRGKQIPLR